MSEKIMNNKLEVQKVRQGICPECRGLGAKPNNRSRRPGLNLEDCRNCGGSGRVIEVVPFMEQLEEWIRLNPRFKFKITEDYILVYSPTSQHRVDDTGLSGSTHGFSPHIIPTELSRILLDVWRELWLKKQITLLAKEQK